MIDLTGDSPPPSAVPDVPQKPLPSHPVPRFNGEEPPHKRRRVEGPETRSKKEPKALKTCITDHVLPALRREMRRFAPTKYRLNLLAEDVSGR